jgi:hypothetical protein
MQPDAADRPGEHSDLQPAESPTPPPGDGLDLLTIGLMVFFVALIVIVGALLLLPAIF